VIAGIGTDIIAIERIRRAEEKSRGRLSQRVLTPLERSLYARRHDGLTLLAGRFAAKEAVAKALGTGLGRISWQEIEIASDSRGRPQVRLYGAAAAEAERLGLAEIQLSLSHCEEYAVAFAVAVQKPGGE